MPMGAACELWVVLLALIRCVRDLYNARTRRSQPWGRNAIQQILGRASGFKRSVTNDALNNVALTSYYTGYLKNAPMEV